MKKIKLNWGQGLALGMGIFMVFIILMGVYMFNQTSDEYDSRYYEKGLAFDTVYNKERQVVVDKLQPKIELLPTGLHIAFAAPASGSIRFERLADASLNRVIPFTADASNIADIPLNGFKAGRWDLSFEWKNKGKKYLYQQQIMLK